MNAPSVHSSYEELVLTRREHNEYREGYAEARQALHDWPQAEVSGLRG